MDFDDDALDLLEDDGDGVNETCLFFDEDSEDKSSKGPPQKAGCSLVLLLGGTTVISAGFLLEKFFA